MQVVVRVQLLMPNATFATGQFARVCRKDDSWPISATGTLAALSVSETVRPGANSRCTTSPTTLFLASAPQSLGLAVLTAKLNNQTVDALIDTGASENFIDKELADRLNIKGLRTKEQVLLATRQKEINIESRARADIEICGRKYRLQFAINEQNLCGSKTEVF